MFPSSKKKKKQKPIPIVPQQQSPPPPHSPPPSSPTRRSTKNNNSKKKPTTTTTTPRQLPLPLPPSLSKRQKLVKRCKSVLKNSGVRFLLFLLTLSALFADDIRIALFRPAADPWFSALAVIAMVVFTIELVLRMIVRDPSRRPGCGGCGGGSTRDRKLANLRLALDLLNIASLIMDITVVSFPLYRHQRMYFQDSRPSFRLASMLRLFWLIRVPRLLAALSRCVSTSNKPKPSSSSSTPLSPHRHTHHHHQPHYNNLQTDDDEQTSGENIQVEKTLNEQATTYLVCTILLMGFCLPFLDGTISPLDSSYQQGGLEWLHRFPQQYNATGTVTDTLFLGSVRSYAQAAVENQRPLIYMEICVMPPASKVGEAWVNGCTSSWPWTKLQVEGLPGTEMTTGATLESAIASLRPFEYVVQEVDECYDVAGAGAAAGTNNKICHSTAVFSLKSLIVFWSWLNMVKTALVLIVLLFTSTLFFIDARVYVIGPIKRMRSIVHALAENPLAAIKKASSSSSSSSSSSVFLLGGLNGEGAERTKGMETQLLEDVLLQISRLLQIGFGAAGAEIIAETMTMAGEEGGDEGGGRGGNSSSNNSSMKALNPLAPGKKITAIYGFVDVRNFTDMTEGLQDEVFGCVNVIAGIVHGATHAYFGMANKNVGDAFLSSWKICDGSLPGFSSFAHAADAKARAEANEIVRAPPAVGEGEVQRSLTPTEMAESALTAFLKCVVDMDRANDDVNLLKPYRTHPALLQRFPQGEFRVRCGYGLHVGWAVEGAIGSVKKIDATYISPHVDMAERLEASCKTYGVRMVLSQWFVGLLSPAAQSFLRPLDRITAKAIQIPFTLYTFDIAYDQQQAQAQGQGQGGEGLDLSALDLLVHLAKPKIHMYTKAQLPVEFSSTGGGAGGDDGHSQSSFYRLLQTKLHPLFLPNYREGFEAYLAGDCEKAREMLAQALVYKPGDVPTQRLLRRMEGGNVNGDWMGAVFDPSF